MSLYASPAPLDERPFNLRSYIDIELPERPNDITLDNPPEGLAPEKVVDVVCIRDPSIAQAINSDNPGAFQKLTAILCHPLDILGTV
jgi:hypothetical protein